MSDPKYTTFSWLTVHAKVTIATATLHLGYMNENSKWQELCRRITSVARSKKNRGCVRVNPASSISLLIGSTGQILSKEAKALATPPPSDMLFFLGEITTAASTKWKRSPNLRPSPSFEQIKETGKISPTWNTPISLPSKLQFCECLDFPPDFGLIYL